MNKPKICILIDWYLPGTKAGGPVRSVYSLVSLLKDQFDFYVITTNMDLGKTEPYQDIKPNTLFLKEEAHYYYFSNDQLNTDNLLNLFKTINPDLIYLNSFWSYSFSISVVRLKSKNLISTPVLLAPRGMLGKGAMSLKPSKKILFLFISRALGWYKKIRFHATQVNEQKDIRSRFRSAKIMIAPNINAGQIRENKSEKQVNHLKLFYLSRIAEVKNLHFALEILKEIPADYRIEYDIFGNLEDSEYWNGCKAIIETLPANICVTYKSELQFDNVQKVICNYNALLLPTLNENFGHSIVESLLCGCPVIISDQTPWNDLEKFDAGYAIDLSNKQKFIDAVIALARLDNNLFCKKSNQAITYIRNHINAEETINQYKNLFNDSIKN